MAAIRDVGRVLERSGRGEARGPAEAARGDLGDIRMIQVEYVQSFRAAKEPGEETSDYWRLDPKRSGPSLVMGDIGTHAQHLVEYVSRHHITSVAGLGCFFIAAREPQQSPQQLHMPPGFTMLAGWFTNPASSALSRMARASSVASLSSGQCWWRLQSFFCLQYHAR